MSDIFYRFPCGCEFKQLSDTIKPYDSLPPLEIDYYNLPLNCPMTWSLISSGRTRGVFQLESNLGRSYSKKLEPDNIHHLAALTALLRPGCMNSMLDGKSMTNHFIDRKQKKDEVKYNEQRLEKYLSETFGVLVYQEQLIAISKGMAGFTPEEANKLRKAVGKKDMKLLMSMKEKFVGGCVKNEINDKNATDIFDNIESSGRYLFNSCLSPNTLVEIEGGRFQTLEEVKIGDKILSPKNKEEDEFVEVVNKFDNGEKEVYEITLESGNQIVCTLDHKFMCENGQILPLIEILLKNIRVFYQI